ncbi:MAG: DUF3800 domain-containing protein [Dehalococcoidia bacterium]|nr:DUF3800 domain-containing protein [Dehalococcoidia bacterium]
MYRVFGDESGIHKGVPCYGIGCIVVPEPEVDRLQARVAEVFRQNGVGDREMKWSAIRRHNATIQAARDATRLLIQEEVMFQAIVVNKRLYRNWPGNEEEAFYKTYSFLVKSIGDRLAGQFRVMIDDRSDRYARRAEVVQIVTNRFLQSAPDADNRILGVEKVDSKVHPLLQMTDVWLGAITASTNCHVVECTDDHLGKTVIANDLAQAVGWDGLHFDTMPNRIFNVWHFPIGFRGPTRPTRFSA